MLSGQPDIEILEAHNADEALEAHASASPDVVVLDINLPAFRDLNCCGACSKEIRIRKSSYSHE